MPWRVWGLGFRVSTAASCSSCYCYVCHCHCLLWTPTMDFHPPRSSGVIMRIPFLDPERVLWAMKPSGDSISG